MSLSSLIRKCKSKDVDADASLPLAEKTVILNWLTAIGETDPDVIAEVVESARRDTEARGYFLKRARELPA
jgi:hypothetical protein